MTKQSFLMHILKMHDYPYQSNIITKKKSFFLKAQSSHLLTNLLFVSPFWPQTGVGARGCFGDWSRRWGRGWLRPVSIRKCWCPAGRGTGSTGNRPDRSAPAARRSPSGRTQHLITPKRIFFCFLKIRNLRENNKNLPSSSLLILNNLPKRPVISQWRITNCAGLSRIWKMYESGCLCDLPVRTKEMARMIKKPQ